MKTNILAALLALMLVIVQLFVLQSRGNSDNSNSHKTTHVSNKPLELQHSLTYESRLPAESILSYDMHVIDDLYDRHSSYDIHATSSFNLQLP